MTDHLPECRYQQVIELYSNDLEPDGCEIEDRCICHQLRACEKRVLNDLVPNLHLADMQGYNRGLRAAEAAVAAECHHDDPNEWCVYVEAISALKEKP